MNVHRSAFLVVRGHQAGTVAKQPGLLNREIGISLYHMEPFEQLLEEVRARRLILLAHGALWAPNTHVPMSTRQAIRVHRRELVQLIRRADPRVCPAQDKHRASWRYTGYGRYECGYCAQLWRRDRSA